MPYEIELPLLGIRGCRTDVTTFDGGLAGGGLGDRRLKVSKEAIAHVCSGHGRLNGKTWLGGAP